jgi:hypothetical protein
MLSPSMIIESKHPALAFPTLGKINSCVNKLILFCFGLGDDVTIGINNT